MLPVIAEPGWLQVRLAQSPNESTGWVQSGDVTLSSTAYRLVLDLTAEHLKVYKDGRPVFDFPAGIGTTGDPTVTGHFFVAMVVPLPGPGYAPFVLGTSASRALEQPERPSARIAVVSLSIVFPPVAPCARVAAAWSQTRRQRHRDRRPRSPARRVPTPGAATSLLPRRPGAAGNAREVAPSGKVVGVLGDARDPAALGEGTTMRQFPGSMTLRLAASCPSLALTVAACHTGSSAPEAGWVGGGRAGTGRPGWTPQPPLPGPDTLRVAASDRRY
jgi:hypothetical protein